MANFKKFFVYSLIGSLIISALVAVVTVLIGQFNEVTNRVFMDSFHGCYSFTGSLAFIWNDEKENTFEKLTFFTNVIFCLIIISFFSSIFWCLENNRGRNNLAFISDIFYYCLCFASRKYVIQDLKRENYMDMIIYFNFLFIFIVVFDVDADNLYG